MPVTHSVMILPLGLNNSQAKCIAIYFTHGNRDFLLGQRYAQKAGMTLLAEQTVIDLYGTQVLLLHGDEMCTQDLEYQRFGAKAEVGGGRD